MTTPETADVRAWARENGYQVAERGRLPAEVHQAYVEATGGTPAKAGARKTASRSGSGQPTRRPRTAAAGTRPSDTARPARERVAPAAQADTSAEQTREQAAPDPRVTQLEARAQALAERVDTLEKRLSELNDKPKSLFRRKR